jgi:WD40 repeat protein
MVSIQTGLRTVECLAVSPDGQRLAAAGNADPASGADVFGWTVEVWDLTTTEQVGLSNTQEPHAFGLALDPVTGGILTGDAKEGIFADVEEGGVCLEVPGGPLRSFAVSPDGKWLVCGCEFGDNLGRPDFRARLVGWKRKPEGIWSQAWQAETDGYAFNAIAFLPDSKQVVAAEALATRHRRQTEKAATRLTLWDTKTGRELHQSAECAGPPADAVAICGSFAVARGRKGQLFAWDLAIPGSPPIQVPTGRRVAGLAAHPSGRLLATTSEDHVDFWDAPSWRSAKRFAWKVGRLQAVTFSPDGMLAAAGGAKGRVVVWDLDG